MKQIKNLVALFLVAFTFATASAQNADSKKLIVNKWVIDQEAMKPVLKAMLATNPQFLALDEATKESTMTMAMQQLATMKVEYKADGTLQRKDPNGEATGNWILSDDGKEFTNKVEGKADKKYTILELTKTKLSILSSDGRNLILKAE